MRLKQKLHALLLMGGEEIHHAKDEHGDIVVLEQFGERVLNFESFFEQSRTLMNAPYSPVHEYIQVMLLGLIFVKPQHVTLLGLGGGCLASCLHHYFDDVKIDAVELRQIVIDAAHNYFALPRSEDLSVTQSDAYAYLINTAPNSTDLVFSDLYSAHEMSVLQEQENYIEECERVLTSDGWLVLNFHQAPIIDSPLIKEIKTFFTHIYLCRTATDNYILFCGKSKVPKRSVLIERCKELEALMDKPFTRHFNKLVRFGV